MFYIYAGDELIYRPLEPELSLLNPKLTLEMGKAGSLEFGIPSTNKHYNTLAQLVTTVRVSFDNEEIFYGRVLSVKKAFNNVKTVYCEGDLSYLIDTVQKCTKYNGSTHDLFNKIIAAHNARADSNKQFTVGNVTIENRSIRLEGQVDNINVGQFDYKQIAINSIVDEWNNTFDFIKTTLIDYCGGYLRTRHVNGVAYIDYVADYFDTASQTIELGKNLLDLNDELSVDELFTVLIPLGDENLTISSVNGGSDELVNQELVNKYGRIVKTHVFSNVNQASTLKTNAERYMASHAETLRTIEISAVDLHMINPAVIAIHLGDKVMITSLPHGINEALTCTKIEYDMTNAANNKYTFGNPKQTLTERYREDERKQKDTYGNSAASSVGSGGGGGAIAAAAASAAGEEAEDRQKEAEKKFFDAWIGLDEADAGKITLNAIQMLQANDRSRLKNDIGIDLDAASGNVNIHNFKTEYDTNKIEVANYIAQIDSKHTDAESTITSEVARIDAKHDGNYSTISQTVTDTSASIRQEVKRVDDSHTTKEASIEASITNTANGLSSQITLKADKTYVDGLLEAANAKFDNLTTGITSAENLKADHIFGLTGISALGNLYIGENDILDHYHSLSADSNGKVTLGKATFTGPTSFNMADTTFFKNAVSAAETKGANSVTASFAVNTARGTSGVQWGSSYKTARVYLSVTLSNGTTYNGVNDHISIDTSKAYNEGHSAGVTDGREGYTQGTFESVYRYGANGTASGTNQGGRCYTSLYTRYWNSSTRSYDYSPFSATLYYSGSSYSYNLRDGGGWYYRKTS